MFVGFLVYYAKLFKVCRSELSLESSLKVAEQIRFLCIVPVQIPLYLKLNYCFGLKTLRNDLRTAFVRPVLLRATGYVKHVLRCEIIGFRCGLPELIRLLGCYEA